MDSAKTQDIARADLYDGATDPTPRARMTTRRWAVLALAVIALAVIAAMTFGPEMVENVQTVMIGGLMACITGIVSMVNGVKDGQ